MRYTERELLYPLIIFLTEKISISHGAHQCWSCYNYNSYQMTICIHRHLTCRVWMVPTTSPPVVSLIIIKPNWIKEAFGLPHWTRQSTCTTSIANRQLKGLTKLQLCQWIQIYPWVWLSVLKMKLRWTKLKTTHLTSIWRSMPSLTSIPSSPARNIPHFRTWPSLGLPFASLRRHWLLLPWRYL